MDNTFCAMDCAAPLFSIYCAKIAPNKNIAKKLMINPVSPVINEASVPIKDGKKSIPFVMMTMIEATGATIYNAESFHSQKYDKYDCNNNS